MRNWLLLLVACVAFALVAPGCGGDDDDGGGDGNGSAATTRQETTSTGGGGTAAKTATVDMKDISFQPETVTIPKGGTVTWVNEDSVGHDVTADDDSFKSGDPGGISGGGEYEHTFDEAGSFKYVCTVHPGMEGTVDVK
jgi:plastocyanin